MHPENLEGRFAVAPTEQVAVRRDDDIGQSRRGPVFTKQASKDRLEVIADLHNLELAGAVLPNLFGFTDWGVIGGHSASFHADTAACRSH